MYLSNFIENSRRLPFVRLLVPFILGIIYVKFFCLNLFPTGYLLLPLFSVYILATIFNIQPKHSLSWIWGIIIFIMMFGFGTGITKNVQKKSGLPLYENIIYKVVVEENPVALKKSNKIRAKVINYLNSANNIKKSAESVYLYFPKDSVSFNFKIGDKILIKTKLSETPKPCNPEEFNYAEYLAQQRVFSSAYVKDYCLISNNSNNLIFNRTISDIQKFIFSKIGQLGISGDEYSVLRALSLGDKQLIDDNLIKTYSGSGAMHVLAVSGLHVGLVYLIFSFLLQFLTRNKVGKIVRTITILSVLWIYAALSGFSPSVSRASVMFSFVIFGDLINRKGNIYNSLAASALLLCVINPLNIFKLGFQLSYSAVLSIVYFQPKIYKLVYIKNKLLDFIYALATVSIAAQIGTAAISIFYFKMFPNYFLVTNILIIPLVTIIMILFFCVVFLFWVPIINKLIAQALDFSLYLSNQITYSVEKLPYSVSHNLYISQFQMFIIVFIIIAFAVMVKYKKPKNLLIFILLSTLAFASFYIADIKRNNQKMMIVYCTQNSSYISFVNGKKSLNVRDSLNIYNNFDFNTQNNKIKLGINDSKNVILFKSAQNCAYVQFYKGFVWFCGKSVKFANASEHFISPQPIPVDYLIVNKYSGNKPQNIFKNYSPQIVIVDSSVSVWLADLWESESAKNNFPVYNVIKNGAFIADFNSNK